MVRVIAHYYPRGLVYKGLAETIDAARGAVVLSLNLQAYQYDWRDEAGRTVYIYYRSGPRDTFREIKPFEVEPWELRYEGPPRPVRL